MSLSTTNFDMSKQNVLVDGVTLTFDAMTNVATPPATQATIVAGTAAPTFSAKKGTLYINLTGSSASTRLYVNTDGATTWTNFTSAA